jgi:hypothetical protein
MPDDLPPRPPSLGRLIDQMWALREAKRAKAAEIGALEAQLDALEAQLLARFDADDIDSGRGKKATAAIGQSVCFTITDFELFAKFVRRHNYFHLFQRRVADLAVHELYQGNRVVPGLTPFTRRRINLRSLQ